MSQTQKIVAAIITVIGLILVAIFGQGLYHPNSEPTVATENVSQADQSGVKVVSTNPATLDGATISPTQTLEITFNKPLVHDDTRVVVEPKADYRTDLSSDHKTLKIIPKFNLGSSYTLTIKSGYGTDTGEKLDQDLNFHFDTISYNGV